VDPQSLDIRNFCFHVEQEYLTCAPYVVELEDAAISLEVGSTTKSYENPADNHVPAFHWRTEVSPINPSELVFPNTRVCFDWSTSFVDEALGEDIGGEPIACTQAADCCTPGEPCPPERCAAGACVYEQSYPARFAEYELLLDGPYGAATLGEYYDGAGVPVGIGQRRYLDSDGCIPSSVLPPEVLLQPDDGSGQAQLSLRARVRTQLGLVDGAPPAYDIAYADIDPMSPLDDLTWEVVEFELPTSTAELLDAGWGAKGKRTAKPAGSGSIGPRAAGRGPGGFLGRPYSMAWSPQRTLPGSRSRTRDGGVRSLGNPGVRVGVKQGLAQLSNGKLS
jgi:hypothetical protein